MKYIFKVEIETNDNFDKIINRNLEWNRQYNPNRTFKDEALSSLYTTIEDNIINDGADDIDNVNISIITPIDKEKLNEISYDYCYKQSNDWLIDSDNNWKDVQEAYKAGYNDRAKEEQGL